MRKPSAATELRRYKSMFSDAERKHANAMASLEQYRSRATRAEQEVAEWKRRFDDLLRLRHGVQTVGVPSALDERVRAMVKNKDSGLYIEAIKLVRNEAGLGLKEAKDYVDALKPVAP